MTMPDISNILEPRRIYRQAEKTQFFEAFERLGKVSLAAREVGIQPASCYRWLVTAGIDAKQRGRARRAEYFRLRESGATGDNGRIAALSCSIKSTGRARLDRE